MTNTYYVYILANNSGTLYIGVTNNISRRVYEHKQKLVEGFTKKYNVDKLIYFEECSNIYDAIQREKQLKGWTRAKKLALIKKVNPELVELEVE